MSQAVLPRRFLLAAALLACQFVVPAAGQQLNAERPNPKQKWKLQDGREANLTFVRSDFENVWFKEAKNPYPFNQVVPEHQKVIRSLSADFSWRFQSESLVWPKTQVSLLDEALEKPIEGKPGHFRYLTPHFEFACDARIGGKAAAKVGRLFEGCHQVVSKTPWGLRPDAPQAERHKVELLTKREDFLAKVKSPPHLAPGSQLMGVYQPWTRTVYVPFDSVGLVEKNGVWDVGREFSSETLRHEVVHQMTHSMLHLMPWWLSEGIAEYLAKIPVTTAGVIESNRMGSKAMMEKLVKEGNFRAEYLAAIMSPQLSSPVDEVVAQIEASRAHLVSHLKAALNRRERELAKMKERVDCLISGLPIPKPSNDEHAVESAVVPETKTSTLTGERDPFGGVDRYHIAKILVYYLQHLHDKDGKTMTALMWHFRQWADEHEVAMRKFKGESEAFEKSIDDLIKRINDDTEERKSYQKALITYFDNYAKGGVQKDLPVANKPIPPEQKWLNEVPPVPSKAGLGAAEISLRCEQIVNSLVPKDVESVIDRAFLDQGFDISR
jgi:hypothetical protein